MASNTPDLDGVMLLWGDQMAYLEHHRGITHGPAGLLAQALVPRRSPHNYPLRSP